MAKTTIANTEAGSSVRAKLNASEIRPEATLIDIDAAGDQTIDCGLGIRLYDAITADRVIGTISNLTLPTIIDIDGAFTVDFSAALKANADNDFYGNAVLVAGKNYITIVPKEAGGMVVTYVAGMGEAVVKATTAVLAATIDMADGSFQPKTSTGTINITTISNQGLGIIDLQITGGDNVTIDVALIPAADVKGVFDATATMNILRIICYDATGSYYAVWQNNPVIEVPLQFGDPDADIVTGTKQAYYRHHKPCRLVGVHGFLKNVATGTTLLTMDIMKNGVTVAATDKLTWDASEFITNTAATPIAITDEAYAAYDEYSVDVLTVGDTAAGKGPVVTLLLVEI